MIGTPRSALRYRSLAGAVSPQMQTSRSGVRASQVTTQTGQPWQRVRMTEEVDEFPHHAIPPRRSAQRAQPSYEEEQDYTTSSREELRAPQSRRREHHHGHWMVGVGLTLIVLVICWIISTSGASFWVTHLSDPATFGPTHGNEVSGVFGGGDSVAHPTILVGMNVNGHVEIIVLHPNQSAASQHALTPMIPGPNLVLLGFPDPLNAEVQLATGDYNHDGHLDLQITLLSTSFNLPFQRYSLTTYLYGDGKGNLKQAQQA